MSRPELPSFVGGVEDVMATEALAVVHRAFHHYTRAHEVVATCTDLDGTDFQQMAMYGPWAFITPAFAKLVTNVGTRAVGLAHYAWARRILPDV